MEYFPLGLLKNDDACRMIFLSSPSSHISKLFIDVNFGHFFARFVATLLLERGQIWDGMAHPDFLPLSLSF